MLFIYNVKFMQIVFKNSVYVSQKTAYADIYQQADSVYVAGSHFSVTTM